MHDCLIKATHMLLICEVMVHFLDQGLLQEAPIAYDLASEIPEAHFPIDLPYSNSQHHGLPQAVQEQLLRS